MQLTTRNIHFAHTKKTIPRTVNVYGVSYRCEIHKLTKTYKIRIHFCQNCDVIRTTVWKSFFRSWFSFENKTFQIPMSMLFFASDYFWFDLSVTKTAFYSCVSCELFDGIYFRWIDTETIILTCGLSKRFLLIKWYKFAVREKSTIKIITMFRNMKTSSQYDNKIL